MKTPPDFVVFHEVVRTSRVWIKGKAYTYMWSTIITNSSESIDLTVVNPAWLASLGKPTLCTFSKPFKSRNGTLMVTPKFGPDGWELPAVDAKVIQ